MFTQDYNMNMHVRKHLKLYILIALELFWIGSMIVNSLGDAVSYEFHPKDFLDSTRDRSYISCDDLSLHIAYDRATIEYDDEGNALDDDLMSPRFAIGSGGYDVIVRYDAQALNTYIKLHTDSEISEAFTIKEYLLPDRKELKAKMYIPFARSVHDAQIDLAYTGPGDISIYSIQIIEDIRYRWVPVVGCVLLFCITDFLIVILFGRSWCALRSYIRLHYELPVLAGGVLIASFPLISGSLYWGHDIDFHLARIIAVSHEIAYGQFPVRMLTDMLHGYGYPTSIFYCDLFLYPFSCLYLLGLPLRQCWQLYIFVVNVATAAISYHYFKAICKERDAALVGSLIYLLSAYRIIDLYLRCAMGECTAIAFIPIVMSGIYDLLYEGKYNPGWRRLSIGMTLIALCHLLTLEMVSSFLFLLCLLEWRRFLADFQIFLSVIKAGIVTILLSCWFVFPMLLSMKAISLKMYDVQLYIQAQGAHISQIFNIFMPGNGFTTPGTYHEMPLSMGAGLIAAFVLQIYGMLRSDTKERYEQRTAFCLSTMALLMSTYLFPWDTIASLTEGRIDLISRLARMVQFPWRYMEIATAVLSLSAVMLLRTYKKNRPHIYLMWVAILISGTLLSVCSFYNSFINESKAISTANEYFIEDEIGLEEYLPSEAGIIEDMGTFPVLLDGTAKISSYRSEGGERYLTVSDCSPDTTIVLPIFSYPGYHAVDRDTDSAFETCETEDKRLGLRIPAGYDGTIRIYYREPELWRFFEIVSLISLLLYICTCSKPLSVLTDHWLSGKYRILNP